jgi:hypothetical protein
MRAHLDCMSNRVKYTIPLYLDEMQTQYGDVSLGAHSPVNTPPHAPPPSSLHDVSPHLPSPVVLASQFLNSRLFALSNRGGV